MASVYKSLSKSNGQKAETSANGVRKNKQRVLILSSRGVTYRQRHFMNDLATMMPHGRKDAKFDSKTRLHELNELCEMYNCNNCLFFEARKGQDLYMWLSKVPNGPTIKFHVQNLHTMEEVSFQGNALRGSRALLSFDVAFDNDPFLRVCKELFLHTFGVPQGARKSKPFIDRVLGFSIVDGRIWMRHYEIKEVEATEKSGDGEKGEEEMTKAKKATGPKGLKDTDVSLVEIGPRAVFVPIIVQEGSFGGPIVYENKQFVSPNQVRADLRKKIASRHDARADQTVERLAKKGDLGLRTHGGRKVAPDELDSKVLFA